MHKGKEYFAAVEAGLPKNVLHFKALKVRKRYFMTTEYRERTFSTVKADSHCGAVQGRPTAEYGAVA